MMENPQEVVKTLHFLLRKRRINFVGNKNENIDSSCLKRAQDSHIFSAAVWCESHETLVSVLSCETVV